MSKSSLGMIADSWGAMQPAIREQIWATLTEPQRGELGALWPDVELATAPDAQKQPVAKVKPKSAQIIAPKPKTPKVNALAPIPEMPDPQDIDDGLDIDLGAVFQEKQQLFLGKSKVSIQSKPNRTLSIPLVHNSAPAVTQPQQMPQSIEVLKPIMQQLKLMEAQIAELRASIAKPSLRADLITILRGGSQEPWHLSSLSHSSQYSAYYGADGWEKVEADILCELFRMRSEGLVRWDGGTTDKVRLK